MPTRATKKTSLTESRESKERHVDKLLADNFTNLQKAMTNLAIKFESLSDRISKLLELFEISAKSFVEQQKQGKIPGKHDEKLIEKLDELIDQNKIIAKGLSIIGEKLAYTYSAYEEGEEASPAPEEYPEEYYAEAPSKEYLEVPPEGYPPQPPAPRYAPRPEESQYYISPPLRETQAPTLPGTQPISYAQKISRAITQEPQPQYPPQLQYPSQPPMPPRGRHVPEPKKLAKKSRIEELRDRLRPRPLPR